ncbi:hypothetical protein EGW08_013415 [Elysia chlorotica]|uniref:Uncharacterized protein n=1 Tax=Elysia chlorotica TaxID=188477 RepID=A0A433TBE0_ELYCH|nr:hypothetical protein EGW08_013415 [Elysia chlorotica]
MVFKSSSKLTLSDGPGSSHSVPGLYRHPGQASFPSSSHLLAETSNSVTSRSGQASFPSSSHLLAETTSSSVTSRPGRLARAVRRASLAPCAGPRKEGLPHAEKISSMFVSSLGFVKDEGYCGELGGVKFILYSASLKDRFGNRNFVRVCVKFILYSASLKDRFGNRHFVRVSYMFLTRGRGLPVPVARMSDIPGLVILAITETLRNEGAPASNRSSIQDLRSQ